MTLDLPDGWTLRRPTDADVPAILALAHAVDIALTGQPDFAVADVREVLYGPNHDLARDEWLVEDADRLVAWAHVTNMYSGRRETVDIYLHPACETDLYPGLLALTLARIAERAGEADVESLHADAAAVLGDDRLRAALVAAGFSVERRYARMHRDLTGDERPPVPADGLRIRTVDPADESDVRAFYQVIDAAFADLPDYHRAGFDGWWQRATAQGTAPFDEWFVADLAGAPVGVLQSVADAEEDNGGWVRNLAVLPTHRGRGIARTLLGHAFAVYAAKGRTWAGLGADTQNPTGAFRLYESVGMRAAYQADTFTLEITRPD